MKGKQRHKQVEHREPAEQTSQSVISPESASSATISLFTYKRVSLDELGPVHVEPAQLLGQAPAGLRVRGLDQEAPHLVQVGLSGAPLSHGLRGDLEHRHNITDHHH